MTKKLVLIHLSPAARLRAAEASFPLPERQPRQGCRQYDEMCADAYDKRREFVGPRFENCVHKVRANTAGVTVLVDGDVTYFYPMSTIARVKIEE